MKSTSGKEVQSWRFLTNHAHVLQCIADDPTLRLRDIAQRVGVTERTVAQIVRDLEEAGYLSKRPAGRRNHYDVHLDRPLRHPLHRHNTVGALIAFLHSGRRAAEAVVPD